MWSKGILEIDGVKVEYQVKHFEEGSVFGIDEGKVSKLFCYIGRKEIISYDRGDWDKKPTTAVSRKAYKALLEKFN